MKINLTKLPIQRCESHPIVIQIIGLKINYLIQELSLLNWKSRNKHIFPQKIIDSNQAFKIKSYH